VWKGGTLRGGKAKGKRKEYLERKTVKKGWSPVGVGTLGQNSSIKKTAVCARPWRRAQLRAKDLIRSVSEKLKVVGEVALIPGGNPPTARKKPPSRRGLAKEYENGLKGRRKTSLTSRGKGGKRTSCGAKA